jgi:hypothetical protein
MIAGKIKAAQLIRIPLICAALCAGACGPSVVAPLDKMARVEMTITEARQSNAINHAPLELKFAEDKLRKARLAVEKEDFEQANRMAEEALIDAQLAEAKSRSTQAKKVAREIQDSIADMRREIDRTQKYK